MLAVVMMLASLSACGGEKPQELPPDDPQNTPEEGIDIIGNDYRVIYDVSDMEAVSLANEMIAKIQEKSGKKLKTFLTAIRSAGR